MDMILTIIMICVFVIFSTYHLVLCFKENDRLRKITKPFCCLPLFIIAVINCRNLPILCLAPLAGILGDLFLIWKKKNICFVTGTLLFLIGHVFYLFVIIRDLLNTGFSMPIWLPIGAATINVLLIFALYPITKKPCGKLAFLGNFYIPFLCIIDMFAIILTTQISTALFGLMIAVGYFIFILSDLIVIYTKFISDFKRNHFYIMLTYLLAQFLICYGIVLIEVM